MGRSYSSRKQAYTIAGLVLLLGYLCLQVLYELRQLIPYLFEVLGAMHPLCPYALAIMLCVVALGELIMLGVEEE